MKTGPALIWATIVAVVLGFPPIAWLGQEAIVGIASAFGAAFISAIFAPQLARISTEP